jgi:prenyltransferase beta subunit
MIEIEKAITFVERNGTSLEIARLEAVLGKGHKNDSVLNQIKELQNSDGGFNLQIGAKSSISDTGFILTWLSDLKCLQSEVTQKAIKYLESVQNENGSWNEKVNSTDDTPEWRESNNHKAILYQTANTLFWLAKCSHDKGCIERGVNI